MALPDAPEAKHRPSQAIENLESRLQRLEQHLSARSKDDRARPAPERLQQLHRDIQSLADQSEAAADLLELCEYPNSDGQRVLTPQTGNIALTLPFPPPATNSAPLPHPKS